MITRQTVQLSQDGTTQTLSIPAGFELASSEVVVSKEGEKLIVEPVKKTPISDLLAEFAKEGDIAEEFPDVDKGLLPLWFRTRRDAYRSKRYADCSPRA